MTNHGQVSSVTEQLLEIRYKPNPKILDRRGIWAEMLSAELALSEWLIVENRVDVHDKQNRDRIFVGFRNAGYTNFDASTSTYFADKALKFLRFLLSLDGFENPIFLERIGVRSKFITGYENGFEELRDRYASRFLVLTEGAKEALAARLIDIGGPLNFIDNLGNFNTSSGPMAEEQMQQFITRKGEYPKVGLYFDIDYWVKPNKNVDSAEILRIVRAFSTECWNRHERIRKLICED